VNSTPQTVLLVDDCPEDRLTYRRYLSHSQRHSYSIIEAETGDEALLLCQQQFPDLVLLDYVLPDMDGIEFLDELKKNQFERANLPVIMLTGQGNEQIAVQAMKSGAAEYLVKNNLTPESLRLAIKNIEERQAALKIRQQTEETLQVYAAELEELYNHAPCGYHSLDADGTFIRINDTELKMLGYNREELVDKKKFSDLLTSESLLIFRENFPRLKQRGWVRDLEFQMLCKDDTILPVSVSATAVKDATGNYLFSRSVIMDISKRQAELHERQQIEKKLCQTRDELEIRVEERTADLVQLYKQLQKQEARFRELAETIDEVFYITAPGATKIIYVSPAYEKIWGRTSASLYQNPNSWIDAIHPDDRARILSAFNQQLQGEQLKEEYRIIKPNGELRWIFDRNFHVYDEGGQLLRYVGVATDITSRKLAEIELREMSTALSNAVEGISHLDCQGRYLMVNQAYANVVGYTSEEMVGMEWEQTVHPQDIEMMTAAYQQMLSVGKVEAEARGICKDGSIFYKQLVMIASYDEQQRLTGHYCFMKDISDRKYAEAERKKAEQKIQQQAALLDIASDAIFVRDLEHNILFWNSGAERLYGWTAAEAMNNKAIKLFCRKIVPQIEQILQTVLESGSWQGELQKSTKSGQEVIVSSRMTLVRDEAGQPKSILIVDTDITEKKQLEAQFYRAQRLESLGTLASGIAHDINNILTPILGFAQLLPRQLPDLNEQNRRLLKIMTDNAKRGAELVKQILLFSRGEPEKPVFVQLKYLIKEIERIIKETFPKSIEINCDRSLQAENWTVLADPTQIYQVLMNLCVNARDAMPNGGKLTIAAENRFFDQNYARINLEAKVGNYVVITVSDTGCGIPREIQERIFEPFFTTKESGKGTGLGLATVIGIVQNHGGFVKVESEMGKGSQFQVCLPAIDIKATQENSDSQIVKGNGELILVVDDEAPILEITKASLLNYNYQVLTTCDGQEAFSVYTQHQEKIAVVLMDMQMPTMSGLNTIRLFRQINPSLKVIATSGLTSNRQLLADSEIEIQAFLSKPYTIERLLDTIHCVITDI
jgi:PAS domain S-box-containing protein